MDAKNEKAPSAGNTQGSEKHIIGTPSEYGEEARPAMVVCPAVTVALALEELERLRAIEQLPTPELLMERLQARDSDFNLLAGVVSAYLRNKGVLSV